MGSVVPRANDPFAGVTAIETNIACPTVSVAEPATVPKVAVIEALPTASPLANPPAPTPATDDDDELQVTELVRFCVLPLLKVPVAVNCWLFPLAMLALAGLTAIDANTGTVTVRAAEPTMVPEAAEMVDDP